MKLGKDTASVSNWSLSGTKGQPTPEVGMGITILMWTDRHAGTITRVSPSGKTIWYQQDEATRTDDHGMSESQEYEYKADTNAEVRSARLTKSGAWKDHGTQIALGYRNEYHDFSF